MAGVEVSAVGDTSVSRRRPHWSKGQTLLVSVKTMSGKVVTIALGREDTISELKQELQDEVHLLSSMQQLYLGSETVEDSRQLGSYQGLLQGTALKLIGVRPGAVAVDATRARLLARFMDLSATAKDDSVREAKERTAAFEARRRQQLERQEALQLAHDCGKRFASAPHELRRGRLPWEER